jgi:hypothetical protein
VGESFHSLPAANRMPALGATRYTEDCWKRVFAERKPLLIQGYLDLWPASRLWDFDRLRASAGDRQVLVTILGDRGITGLDRRDREPMSFRELLDRIDAQTERTESEGQVYLAFGGVLFTRNGKANLDVLFHDVLAPSIGRPLGMANLWIGSGGNTSSLHFDPLDGVLGVLRGRKRLVIFPPAATRNLYPILQPSNPLGSHVDLTDLDLKRFPRVADAPYWEVDVDEGAAVYIPPGYWHMVRSEGLNMAVNMWWRPTFVEYWRNPALRPLRMMNIRTFIGRLLHASTQAE